MKSFNFEWWTVNITDTSGTETWEFKGKNRENVIEQIEKEVQKSRSEENKQKPWWERKNEIISVDWDSLKLDRIGYQRMS